MKGGYQILDLTAATAGSPVEVKGIYKAAAANNGKPVLILTNDGQRVYAEIAEDDGDYVTCYISAEGKTVNITIEPDDSVTTVISDPGASITGLEQTVNEIAGNIGDVDDLTTTSKEVVGAVNELNSKFIIETETVTFQYNEGTIGTRAFQNANVSQCPTGYKPFSINVVGIADSDAYQAQALFFSDMNAGVNIYRAKTIGITTTGEVVLRIVWMKN